jgi:hypothetical protein
MNVMAKIEILNTMPEDWDATNRGDRLFEICKNDRDFQVGDCLVLRKFNPVIGFVVNDKGLPFDVAMKVSFIADGGLYGLPAEWVVMSLVPWVPAIHEDHICRCGCKLSFNPHPDAGVPTMLAQVGSVWECIPCAARARSRWCERALAAELKISKLEAL